MPRDMLAPNRCDDLPLFQPPPVSRRTDPSTSHEAEAKIRRDGSLSAQCAVTLAALTAYLAKHRQSPTVAELAGGDDHLIRLYSKRLPNLRELGHVANPGKRVCKNTGNRCLVWEVTA